ncbi:hypothetical protein [Spongiactinospora sp. TRM90649]|uniref:hypothetical protein n=1 Tax=Spongiactinospora sp. TRM90649 TaxID=3031114 RepID=UPI0023FA2287|nr:hypothetical protein [Spongiactinospora sp. TRM90649]MDF5753939.1 hypothetical protein [Spongiactinospora sp. TRM90649]
MDGDPTATARIVTTFDPDGLTSAQRYGDACVVCHKKWPRPRVRVGRLPDDTAVLACDDCAEALTPPTGLCPFPGRRRAAYS